MGAAFSDVDTTLLYYPTVGLDTNQIIHFNFGQTPFEFDLMTYILQQQKIQLKQIKKMYANQKGKNGNLQEKFKGFKLKTMISQNRLMQMQWQ